MFSKKDVLLQVGIVFLIIIIGIIFAGSTNGATIHVPGDYSTIQAGIDAAVSGDIVLVAAGIYYENLTMKEGVTIQGAGASVTTINGGGSGDVVIGADNSTMSGFTITNSGFSSFGIRCDSSSPRISNNIIIGNGGGIICLNNSNPLIEYNTVARNDNSSDYGTTGIYCEASSPTVRNNTISNNSARYGILCVSSSPTIRNNIISYNWGGISCRYSSFPALSYNNVWGNTTFGNYDGCLAGNGSISEAPLFVDAANGNYHLQPGSPCIDAGDPADLLPAAGGGTRIDTGAFEYIFR